MLKAVSTDDSQCAMGGATCSSADTIAHLARFAEAATAPVGARTADDAQRVAEAATAPVGGGARAADDAQRVVEKVAKTLGCESERCVVSHPRVVDFIERAAGPEAVQKLAVETQARFKPRGPRDSTALLSNFDIDAVLSRWAGEPAHASFYNCPFAMMDFDRVKYPFSDVDVAEVRAGRARQRVTPPGAAEAAEVARPCDTLGCVLNTDTSRGPGKHWVCVFVDMRGEPTAAAPWTVEYFNSAGNPPPAAMARWIARTVDALIDHRRAAGAADAAAQVRGVAVTTVTHQRSRTECGLYTMFYIRARLDGNPHTMFVADRVPDRDMTEFRRHVFSS